MPSSHKSSGSSIASLSDLLFPSPNDAHAPVHLPDDLRARSQNSATPGTTESPPSINPVSIDPAPYEELLVLQKNRAPSRSPSSILHSSNQPSTIKNPTLCFVSTFRAASRSSLQSVGFIIATSINYGNLRNPERITRISKTATLKIINSS